MRAVRFAFAAVMSVLVVAVFSPDSRAQMMGGAAEKVQWSVLTQPDAPTAGDQVTLRFQAQIEEGWKMYAVDSPPPSRGVKVLFDSVATPLSAQGNLQQSEPKRGYDPNFKKDVSYFETEGTVRQPFAIAESATGAQPVTGQIEFMVCNASMCLPPTRTPFQVTVDVQPASSSRSSSGASSPAASSPSTTSSSESATATESTGEEGGSTPSTPESEPPPSASSLTADLDAATSGGMWGFLLLAIGAGGAALLTPCVFPMIPLTVSYFTKHTESRAEAVRMSIFYGLAIVLTFTGLGVAMAMILGASGAQTIAANPWVNFFIGAVFVVFALSLLGLFELRLPSGLVNFFNRQGNEQSGLLGVVFMGLTLTLVSFSCTAPFVGGLLAATAGGAWFHPVVGMVAFSTTFALPFVGFAMFPRGLERLPKSGGWMNAIKVTLGFVELAAALKFLSNADLIWGTGLLSRPLAIAITVVVFALAGIYLLGKLRLAHEPPIETIGSLRLLAATAFLGTALYMLPGLFGAPLGALDAYLPPRQPSDVSLLSAVNQPASTAEEGDLAWHTDDLEGAVADAREQGKPIFIDFTGYTCTNCRDMEANVFPKPAVTQRFQDDFVLLRLYTDDLPDGAEFQRFQLRLTGTTALPTYAVVDPADRSLLRKVSGVMPPDDFTAFLDRGKHAYQSQQELAEARQ